MSIASWVSRASPGSWICLTSRAAQQHRARVDNGFRDANPELCKAVLSALQQACEFIETGPGAAAEIFAGMTPDGDTSPEALADMIGDLDLVYTAPPAGLMRIAEFMQRTGG